MRRIAAGPMKAGWRLAARCCTDMEWELSPDILAYYQQAREHERLLLRSRATRICAYQGDNP